MADTKNFEIHPEEINRENPVVTKELREEADAWNKTFDEFKAPLEKRLKVAEKEARIDPKTQMMNHFPGREHFRKIIKAFTEKSGIHLNPGGERKKTVVESLTVAKLDFYLFSWWNDVTGSHTFGDWLLMEFGDETRRLTREEDCAIRDGGEEFIIVAPNIGTLDSAEGFIKRFDESKHRLIDLVIENHLVAEHTREQASRLENWADVEVISGAVKALISRSLSLAKDVKSRERFLKGKRTKGGLYEKTALLERLHTFFGSADSKIVSLFYSYLNFPSWGELQRGFLGELDEPNTNKEALLNEVRYQKERVETYWAPKLLKTIFNEGARINIGALVFPSRESIKYKEFGTVFSEVEEVANMAKEDGAPYLIRLEK